jgi:hypothetical protein
VRRRRLSRIASLMLVALLALAIGGCGGDEDSETTSSASPSAGSPTGATGATGKATGPSGGTGSTGGAGSPAAPGGAPGPGSRRRPDSRVDLTVDPDRIRGAVVTGTGAVQTLPPSSEAQETAQENSYSSIKAFGEEAEGEEATNITFALVQYLTAKAEGDWATACARIYGPLRENLETDGRECVDTFGTLMSRVPAESRAEQAEIDVSSVRRGDDDRAFVIYKTPETLSADMPMYFEEGVWKVGALEAYVLTPGQLR